MISCNISPRLLSTILVGFVFFVIFCHAEDPTDGFTEVPLTKDNFVLQQPYNLQPDDKRYSFDNGIRKMWVYSNDEPFNDHTDTKPRTEIRMTGYDYSDGVWQFEGYGFVPNGTTGVSIMQIFGAAEHSTSFMLHVYDGQLMYYHIDVIEDDIYDRWFRVNVIHTVGGNISCFIDGVQKYVADDRGGTDHYFKFGVYTQTDSSDYMESRWQNVKIYNQS